MREENKELKRSIKEFYSLLNNHPDDSNTAHEFVMFLRSFLKIKSEEPLPTIEIMTLIKQHKPNVFYDLKRMSHNNLMLDILTDLSTDLKTANENLERFIK